MSLKKEISKKTKEIYKSNIEWDDDFGKIPGKKNPYLKQGNGIKITVAALSMDLRGYTRMQEENRNKNIARILRSYFVTCGAIIKDNGGKIIATAGDGILALFLGDSQKDACDRAINSAMESKYMLVIEDNKESLNNVFKSYQCPIDFGAGIDYGDVNIVRVELGVDGFPPKDTVWIGRCINSSVKTSDKCSLDYNIGITETVYENMSFDQGIWKEYDGIYRTTKHIIVD